MRLPVVHRLPIVLAGERVGVALAQEANLIRLHQLIDGGWIGPEFAVIELDGALVLLAAVDQLDLLLASDRGGDLRRGDGQTDEQHHGQKNDGQQDKPRFRI